MIPKAEVLAVAEEAGLLPTTVEKDYVLGWVLFAVAEHAALSRWHFKGGTCLKKCYFDTYRFSEDLDFTIPEEGPYDGDSIRAGLRAVAEWVRENAGIDMPTDGIDVRGSINRRNQRTDSARMTLRDAPQALALLASRGYDSACRSTDRSFARRRGTQPQGWRWRPT